MGQLTIARHCNELTYFLPGCSFWFTNLAFILKLQWRKETWLCFNVVGLKEGTIVSDYLFSYSISTTFVRNCKCVLTYHNEWKKKVIISALVVSDIGLWLWNPPRPQGGDKRVVALWPFLRESALKSWSEPNRDSNEAMRVFEMGQKTEKEKISWRCILFCIVPLKTILFELREFI